VHASAFELFEPLRSTDRGRDVDQCKAHLVASANQSRHKIAIYQHFRSTFAPARNCNPGAQGKNQNSAAKFAIDFSRIFSRQKLSAISAKSQRKLKFLPSMLDLTFSE
jgi:hypothetical protein